MQPSTSWLLLPFSLLVATLSLPSASGQPGWEAEYELRELNCTKPGPGQRFPRCSLTEDGDFLPFKCFPSKRGFSRTGRIRSVSVSC